MFENIKLYFETVDKTEFEHDTIVNRIFLFIFKNK